MSNNKYAGVVGIDLSTIEKLKEISIKIVKNDLLAIKIKESEIDEGVFTLSILSTENDEYQIEDIQNTMYNSISNLITDDNIIIPEIINSVKDFENIKSEIIYDKFSG